MNTNIKTVEQALLYAKSKNIFETNYDLKDLNAAILLVKKFSWNYCQPMIKDILNLVNDYLDNRYTANQARQQIFYITGYYD